MSSIFVNYRRNDAPGHAGRLYDRLVDRFGQANVFKDLDSLEPGADFEEIIDETIGRCDAVIAVIGQDWLAPSRDGVRRLDDPQDWVRLELAHALRRKVRVVPALVEGAQVPSASELPEDLRALTRRHAVELSEGAWGSQVGQLIDSLVRARVPSPVGERAAWSVHVRNISPRERVLELRGRGSEHLLTVFCGVVQPTVTLDGIRVPTFRAMLATVKSEDSAELALPITLTSPSGVSEGLLRFQSKGFIGPLKWLTLDVDDQRIYTEGDPGS